MNINYYNEHDLFAATWLRELIIEGCIPFGVVDERDIQDIRPSELVGYTQCHFFAGIGGWAYALRLAGWPEDRPVWTGSCPCQPFSSAGKGGGVADERHLWPDWFHLIRECCPSVIFGEQVEAAIAHGWLDLVQADLEGEGYAFAPIGLPAACVGAPHIRQRLWFVADSERTEQQRNNTEERRLMGYSQSSILGNNNNNKGSQGRQEAECTDQLPSWATGMDVELGISDSSGQCEGSVAPSTSRYGGSLITTSWSDCIWIPCTDGKARPTEPSIFPLAYGVPNRVGLLRGAGNAIVPQVAAEVIKAYMTSC